jgi:hypothetical protein
MDYIAPISNFATLAIDDEGLAVVGMIVGGVLIFSLIHSVRRVLDTRSREQTKREIAAYVAEGTISPDDACRLMQDGNSDTERKIADAVAWGTIKPEKAEALLRSMRSGPGVKPAQAPFANPAGQPAKA